MIEITHDHYRTIAARLREEIATAEWINTTVSGVSPAAGNEAKSVGTDVAAGGEGHGNSFEWRLILSAIVYRRDEMLPEGARRPISDVVPVWWEFQTTPVASDPDPADPAVADPADSADSAAASAAAPAATPNDFSFSELKPFLIDYD